MADQALAALDDARRSYFWFAGPAPAAKALRTAYKARFGKLENAYIAAYWS
ncbi:hypothetical protein ACM25N_16425 [Roseovarius sp. C7]|uniref:hypothetical protein n=1 Tax=Roseovarius sp. C7 TaxID=3398643 RepID=UPI0039F68449